MKNCSRQDLITATRGLVAVWILAIPGVVGAQQSHSRYMEETAVTSTTDPIVENAPSIKRAGVETRDRVVEYSDLNLDNPAGISTLYTRLEAASREVCSPRSSYHDRAMARDWQNCYTKAMDGAIAKIEHLGLEHYHLAKTGAAKSVAEQVADR